MKIENDITRAATLPSSFYKSDDLFEQSREQVFAKSWQLVESGESLVTGNVFPFSLLPSFLNEPLALIRDEKDGISCFSNVCTHRGNILVNHPGSYKKLICNYHGRRFSLNGKFESMPEFSNAKDFPRPCDDLHGVQARTWHQFPFVSLDPSYDFRSVADVLETYMGFLPVSQFRFASEFSKDYLVNAHWALYCDNYLEGFHIPFVHPDLNKILDYKTYTTRIFDHCNVQVGMADSGSPHFDLPEGHIDHGKKIAAYYFWIFPNMMFNFYPWGLSINIVKPLSIKQCRVSFLTYILNEEEFEKDGGALLDKVEREDEFVVENVQRGIQSRFYTTGRFSPSREQGVHHFHRLIASFMNNPARGVAGSAGS